MAWTCIFLLATDDASLALRRYASAACPIKPHGMNIHDARTYIGTAPIVISERGTWDVDVEQPPRSDPRWPTHCACGYVFQDDDTWQLSRNRLYRRQDTGELLTLHEADPGMIWDAPWYLDFSPPWAGPDGRSLVMRLPGGGEWTIDGLSSNGPGWDRKGEPPLLTVTPSILSPRYHGFLQNGVLTDDLEGRQY